MAEEHESSAMPFHIPIVQTDTIVIGKGDNATFGIEYSYSEEIFVSELGLIYEFELNHCTFAPQAHWDRHDGEENSVVTGLSFGFSF